MDREMLEHEQEQEQSKVKTELSPASTTESSPASTTEEEAGEKEDGKKSGQEEAGEKEDGKKSGPTDSGANTDASATSSIAEDKDAAAWGEKEDESDAELTVGWCQEAILDVVETAWFNGTITAVIVANTVTMALDTPHNPCYVHHTPSECDPDNITLTFEITNYVFIVLFTLEIVMKMVAYGARFQTEMYTRGCHWIPRILFLSSVHCSYRCHRKSCQNAEGTG
jgi:hypothetical protein